MQLRRPLRAGIRSEHEPREAARGPFLVQPGKIIVKLHSAVAVTDRHAGQGMAMSRSQWRPAAAGSRPIGAVVRAKEEGLPYL